MMILKKRMSRYRFVFLQGLAALGMLGLAAVERVDAEVVLAGINTDPKSGVEIRLTGYYNDVPLYGFVPVQVEIRNDSGRERSWKFSFAASSSYNASTDHTYIWDVSVKDGDHRTYEVMVPVVGNYSPHYAYPSFVVHAVGYGLRSRQAYYGGHSAYSGSPSTATFGLTSGIAVDHLGPLQEEFKARGHDFRATTLDPQWMSADWRAYIGFESIWVTHKEWLDFSGPLRDTLFLWVARGGDLAVVTADASKGISLPASAEMAGSEYRYMLGTIRVVERTQARLDTQETVNLMESIDQGGWREHFETRYRDDWPLRREEKDSGLQAALLLIVLFAFAVIVGPVNLIWLAGKHRRWRLFWTTPLISMVASLLLVAAILLQDGVGGDGARVAVNLMLPEQKQMVVIQEQFAKTGVLLAREFTFDTQTFLHRIHDPSGKKRGSWSLKRDDAKAGGDWFNSRAAQAHYLETIVPSRTRVEILNPDAASTGDEPPRLLSTIEDDLAELYYIDPAGKCWTAENVKVGESRVMKETDIHRFVGSWWSENIRASGIRVRNRSGLDPLRSRRGTVFARVKEGRGDFIETLNAIDWDNRKQIYIGPCVESGEGPGS